MSTRSTCEMTFNTSLGKRKVVRINNPRPALDMSNVTPASNILINSNVFDGSVGSLTEFVKADVVSVIRKAVI